MLDNGAFWVGRHCRLASLAVKLLLIPLCGRKALWGAAKIGSWQLPRRFAVDLPSEVAAAKQLQPGYWSDQRRKSVATDRALTGAAMDWVIRLPAALRPHATCEQFPRVINAIAVAWPDKAFSLQVLDHMINDYRGGRRGFPVPVQNELAALHAHQQSHSGA